MTSGLASTVLNDCRTLGARRVRGRIFEANVFGIEPQPFDPKAIRRWDERPTYGECLIEAIRLQDIFPFNPRKPTGSVRKLFWTVKDNLPKEIREQLLVCCALGTTLDRKFGADGFFVLESKIWHHVTFDISFYRSPRKKRTLKADFLITMDDLSHNENIARIARVIADRLTASNRKRRAWIKRKRKRRLEGRKLCRVY